MESKLLFFCSDYKVGLTTAPRAPAPGEGHILIGFSRLINALLLIVCIAVGLSATLMIVKNSLL